MKTRYGMLLSAILATALFAACGGSQEANDGSNEKQTVYVETDKAMTVADVAAVTISGTATNAANNFGPIALTYNPANGKYSGNLLVVPDTYSLTLSATRITDGSVVGTATLNNVVVTASAVKTVSFNVASIQEPLPAAGFLITGFSSTGFIPTGGSGTFSVSAKWGGPAPTFLWTKNSACQGTFDTPNAAATNFTDAVAEICTITVTVTDGANTNLKQTKQAQIGVGINLSVGGTFIPSPTITQLVLLGNGGYSASTGKRTAEPTCTIARLAIDQLPTAGNRTCPAIYKINSGPPVDPAATPLILTAPQFGIAVTYDLGGVYDGTKPPKVGVTASCPNSATNGFSLYSFDEQPPVPPSTIPYGPFPIVGSGPGFATCPAPPAVCIGSTNLYWTEPIAFTAPATSDFCTLTVRVDNQGAIDSLPVFVGISQ